MTAENVGKLKVKYQNRVGEQDLEKLAACWKKLDDAEYGKFENVKLKSPVAATVLAVFLGSIGGNRYYIGPTGLGAFRMAVTVLIQTAVALLLWYMTSPLTIAIQTIVGILLLFVYAAEIKFSMGDCKIENYNSLISIYNGIVSGKEVKEQKQSVLAIVGFVLSYLIPPAGIICCAVALHEIKRKSLQNKTLAVLGIIIGCAMTLSITLFILKLLFII